VVRLEELLHLLLGEPSITNELMLDGAGDNLVFGPWKLITGPWERTGDEPPDRCGAGVCYYSSCCLGGYMPAISATG
jgi:hypothetical protein